MLKKVIRYTAKWCGPCRVFAPTFDSVAKDENFKDIDFKVIDVEEDEEGLSEKHKILNIPTVVLIDEKDNVLKKIIGVVSQTELTDIIKSEIKNDE